jgi:hypothetical protein
MLYDDNRQGLQGKASIIFGLLGIEYLILLFLLSMLSMRKSNSLNNLYEILNLAVKNVQGSTTISQVLLDAMGETIKSPRIIDFYQILINAENEVKVLPENDEDLKHIHEIQDLFLDCNYYDEWERISDVLRERRTTTILKLLSKNSEISKLQYLEADELDVIRERFDSIGNEVRASDLSVGIKTFLLKRIANIINAIDQYGINGTQGLEEASKLILFDISCEENNLKEEDRKNPVFKKCVSLCIGLKFFLTPTVYDLLGLPSAIENLTPKIQNFFKHEEILMDKLELYSIHETILVAPSVINHDTLMISGANETKSLPPAKDN